VIKRIMTVSVDCAGGQRVTFLVAPNDPDLLTLLKVANPSDLICAIADEPHEDTETVRAIRRMCERDQLSCELRHLKLDPELLQFLEDHGSETVFQLVSGSDTWWRERGATEAQLEAIQQLLQNINAEYLTRLQLGMDLSAYRPLS
jgi:hypothetical protein